MTIKMNDKAIQKQFLSCLDKFYNDFDREFHRVNSFSDIKQIKDIIYKAFPDFILEAKAENKLSE